MAVYQNSSLWMLLKARAKNEMKIATLTLGGKRMGKDGTIDIWMHSLKYIRVQLALHNDRELQRAENKRPKSCDKHIYDGPSKCQRTD